MPNNGMEQVQRALELLWTNLTNLLMGETTVSMGAGLVILGALIVILSCWRIYSKAGQHGWATLIPIYRDIVFYRITWGSGWFVLLTLIPIVGGIVGLITTYKLSKVFGHGFFFALGLLFFPFLFYPILGLGRSRYRGA